MAEDTRPESSLTGVSAAYRTAAGLPERETDEPFDQAGEAPALTKAYEPEGGYGGDGDNRITNTAATNATEEARAADRDAQAEQRAEQLEETNLTGGETATQEAIVTDSEVTDVKPEPGHTPEDEVVAEGTTGEE